MVAVNCFLVSVHLRTFRDACSTSFCELSRCRVYLSHNYLRSTATVTDTYTYIYYYIIIQIKNLFMEVSSDAPLQNVNLKQHVKLSQSLSIGALRVVVEWGSSERPYEGNETPYPTQPID